MFAGLFCLAWGAFFFFNIDTSQRTFGTNSVSGIFFPRVCAVVISLFAAGLFVQDYYVWKSGVVPKDARSEADRAPDGKAQYGAIKRFIIRFAQPLCLVLILTYMSLIKPLGFILATMGYMPLQMMLLSMKTKRNAALIAVSSIIFPILVYYLFSSVFGMPIPRGILDDIIM
jgi:hypothetical protein